MNEEVAALQKLLDRSESKRRNLLAQVEGYRKALKKFRAMLQGEARRRAEVEYELEIVSVELARLTSVGVKV